MFVHLTLSSVVTPTNIPLVIIQKVIKCTQTCTNNSQTPMEGQINMSMNTQTPLDSIQSPELLALVSIF